MTLAVGPGALAYVLKDAAGKLLGAQSFYPASSTDPILPPVEALKELVQKVQGSSPHSSQHTRLIAYSPHLTLLPSAADTQALGRQWRNLFLPPQPVRLMFKELSDSDYTLCFALPATWAEALHTQLNSPSIDHALQHLPAIVPTLHVRADFCGHNLLLAAMDHRLLYANQFHFEHPHDVVYLILALFHQYQWANDQVPLFLSGDIVENSTIVQLLRRYVRHVSFSPPPHDIHLENNYPWPKHFFHTLLVP
ncbi:MAG: DUF3822 family protein [Chitinophagales bacterium]|nr:DUF3822 family protein [Chitinophagales bacterium]MDW8427644.1 DUF3822 family protein [Chitinophagales bacterium]